MLLPSTQFASRILRLHADFPVITSELNSEDLAHSIHILRVCGCAVLVDVPSMTMESRYVTAIPTEGGK